MVEASYLLAIQLTVMPRRRLPMKLLYTRLPKSLDDADEEQDQESESKGRNNQRLTHASSMQGTNSVCSLNTGDFDRNPISSYSCPGKEVEKDVSELNVTFKGDQSKREGEGDVAYGSADPRRIQFSGNGLSSISDESPDDSWASALSQFDLLPYNFDPANIQEQLEPETCKQTLPTHSPTQQQQQNVKYNMIDTKLKQVRRQVSRVKSLIHSSRAARIRLDGEGLEHRFSPMQEGIQIGIKNPVASSSNSSRQPPSDSPRHRVHSSCPSSGPTRPTLPSLPMRISLPSSTSMQSMTMLSRHLSFVSSSRKPSTRQHRSRIYLPSTGLLPNQQALTTHHELQQQQRDSEKESKSSQVASFAKWLEELGDRSAETTFYIPVDYYTSFERDEEDSRNLMQREAHIGAIALAWASGTRRPKLAAGAGANSSLKASRSNAADEVPTELIQRRRRSLSTKTLDKRTDSINYDPDRGDEREVASTYLRRNESSRRYLNLSPNSQNSPLKTPSRGGFTESLRAESLESDISTTNNNNRLQSSAIQPSLSSEIGDRVEMEAEAEDDDRIGIDYGPDPDHFPKSSFLSFRRRGAQDIPPLSIPQGPLDSTSKPVLQKQSIKSHGIGWRLSERKRLNELRRKIADYSFAFAVLGILIMVLETELLYGQVFTRESSYSTLLKSCISASTAILIGLTIVYHIIDIQLFSVNNCIEDWLIAANFKRILRVAVEVGLCTIHPAPILSNLSLFCRPKRPINTVSSTSPTLLKNQSTLCLSTGTCQTDVICIPLQNFLSIPMFFRLYLIFRVLLLHSTFFTDAGSRSIGALNRVKINVRFILKTLATAKPGRMLLIFILSLWIITSWIMRLCERQEDKDYEDFINSMWLVAITFLSIGYGDMSPYSNCGRSISVFVGVMGSACTALVVAVVARKLELSRAEKHVHNFMQDNKVYKKLRHSAANVLRETWLFYKHTRLVKRVLTGRVRRHQRKFLQAISRLRKAKDRQRKIKEEANSMVDIAKLQLGVYDTVSCIRGDQSIFVQRIVSVEKCLVTLQNQINALPTSIAKILMTNAGQIQTKPSDNEFQTVASPDFNTEVVSVQPVPSSSSDQVAEHQHVAI